MSTKSTLYGILKLLLLRNPTLTVSDAGAIIKDIKLALKAVKC